MKLQNQEIAALASHIYEEIKKKNKISLTKTDKEGIQKFLKRQKDLNQKVQDAQKAVSENRDSFYKSFGIKQYNSYSYDEQSVTKEVEKAKAKALPSMEKIRQEIVLKSLFADETELKKFVQELIDKY